MHVNLPRTRTEGADRPAHAAKPSSAEKASAGNFSDLLKSAKEGASSSAAAPQATPAAAVPNALPTSPI